MTASIRSSTRLPSARTGSNTAWSLGSVWIDCWPVWEALFAAEFAAIQNHVGDGLVALGGGKRLDVVEDARDRPIVVERGLEQAPHVFAGAELLEDRLAGDPDRAAAGDHDRRAARGLVGGVVGRRFEAGVLRACCGRSAPALLDDVRQFVGEEMAAGRRSRRIFAASKHDMAADRVGAGRARRGGGRGAVIRMHAHATRSRGRSSPEIDRGRRCRGDGRVDR